MTTKFESNEPIFMTGHIRSDHSRDGLVCEASSSHSERDRVDALFTLLATVNDISEYTTVAELLGDALTGQSTAYERTCLSFINDLSACRKYANLLGKDVKSELIAKLMYYDHGVARSLAMKALAYFQDSVLEERLIKEIEKCDDSVFQYVYLLALYDSSDAACALLRRAQRCDINFDYATAWAVTFTGSQLAQPVLRKRLNLNENPYFILPDALALSRVGDAEGACFLQQHCVAGNISEHFLRLCGIVFSEENTLSLGAIERIQSRMKETKRSG